MCGRFTQKLTWRQIHDLYSLTGPPLPLNLQPRYNGAPAQDFAACRLDQDGNRAVAQLRWGLVPSWARDARMGTRLINARCETVHTKPSFGAAFRSRRYLVPANGWFEWQRTRRGKQPYFLACGRVTAVLRRSVGALEQGRGIPGNLHNHHDGRLPRAGRHAQPTTSDHRPRPIRRLARSHVAGAVAPRAGSCTLCQPLRAAAPSVPG